MKGKTMDAVSERFEQMERELRALRESQRRARRNSRLACTLAGLVVLGGASLGLARPGVAKEDDSEKGGLPAVSARVAVLEAKVASLQTQLANIQLIPGPQGSPGPKGDKGDKG